MVKAAGKGGKKGPKAYGLAKPLPIGEVLSDVTLKRQWKLLKPIGSGGFGLIYLAEEIGSSAEKNEYVIKIEPRSNGPLFCEMKFFMRAATADKIDGWKKEKRLRHLGVPQYVGSGTNESSDLRFMAMPKFGTDLQKLFEENGKRFPENTVYNLALQLIDALEYIHEQEYVHADIKASNILLGDNPNQVFLVDYGLAAKYCLSGGHVECKGNNKKQHDGTIEFTSRDAHEGREPTRRGDFEILAYCLLQWMCSELPWEDNLNNKDYVAQQKAKYMKDLDGLFKKCFPAGDDPAALRQFFQHVIKLDYDQQPDYAKCRSIFVNALKKTGGKQGQLEFTSGRPSPKKGVKAKPRKRKSDADDALPEVSPKKRNTTPASGRGKKKLASPAPAKTKATKKTPGVSGGKVVKPKKSALQATSPSYKKGLPKTYRPAKAASAATKDEVAATGATPKATKKRTVKRVSNGTQTTPGLKARRTQKKR